MWSISIKKETFRIIPRIATMKYLDSTYETHRPKLHNDLGHIGLCQEIQGHWHRDQRNWKLVVSLAACWQNCLHVQRGSNWSQSPPHEEQPSWPHAPVPPKHERAARILKYQSEFRGLLRGPSCLSTLLWAPNVCILI